MDKASQPGYRNILILLAFSFLFFNLIPSQELSLIATYSLEGKESYSPDGSKSLHIGEIETRKFDDVYTLYKPNTTYWTDDWYRQRKIEINSRGLREDEFAQKPPENTTRVLFLGDSFTFGTGVNASERYTDVVERKLNSGRNRRISSINAGIAGAGVDGFAQFFENRGVAYDPEIVVVSLSSNDIWTRKQFYRYRDEIVENNKSLDYPINSSEQVYLNEKSKELKRNLSRSANGTALVQGLNRIHDSAKDSNIVVHGYLLRPELSEPVKEWAESHKNVSYVPRNPKFSIFPTRIYLIPYDRHYNPVGHYWMAQQLIPEIREIMN